MTTDWITVPGEVVRGHQVASRASRYYSKGTIELQIPFFKERGLDLTHFHRGTLNILISPYTFKIKQAELHFPGVEWTSQHPPEDFSFSRCRVIYQNTKHDGWIYYPHPETKQRHHQNDAVMEVITTYIPDVEYGDRIEIEVQLAEIEVENGGMP